MKKVSVIEVLSYVLICLWIYAALSKLADYPLFISELNKQPFPRSSLSTLAIIIPLVEVGTAILLVFQRTRTVGYKVSLSLMTLFTIYVILAITRAFGHIPCPCAGIIGRMPWFPHLVFNIFFTIVSYACYYLQKNINKNDKTTFQKILFANNRQIT